MSADDKKTCKIIHSKMEQPKPMPSIFQLTHITFISRNLQVQWKTE